MAARTSKANNNDNGEQYNFGPEVAKQDDISIKHKEQSMADEDEKYLQEECDVKPPLQESLWPAFPLPPTLPPSFKK